ncbi:MAG: DUF4397 domain-containing protein [Gammaproteobacteria bacterium]
MRSPFKKPLLGVVCSTLAIIGAQHVLASNASAADVYVVHGINGSDLGADASLPVDVKVNDLCVLSGVTFKDTAGPFDLPTGPNQIDVLLSDSVGNCEGTLAISKSFSFALTENATLIAHLDGNGTPALSKFTNQVQPLGAHDARVTVVHTAFAPPVTVTVSPSEADGQGVTLEALRNGDQSFARDVPVGTYNVEVFPAGEMQASRPVLAISDLSLEEQTAYTAFAVGSVQNQLDVVLLGQDLK